MRNYKVELFTSEEYLLGIEECVPKSPSKYLPDWWSLIPRGSQVPLDENQMANVKNCPSFADFFSQGFVIPMWTDSVLKVRKTGYEWYTSDDNFKWELHQQEQFISHIPAKNYRAVFKAMSPWYIKTEKNVSVLQLPMFYHFNNDFQVLPGIVNTDYEHEINQQVVFTSSKEEIFIKRGTPLAMYIPFERSITSIDPKYPSEKEQKQLLLAHKKIMTKFSGGYIQQLRDTFRN